MCYDNNHYFDVTSFEEVRCWAEHALTKMYNSHIVYTCFSAAMLGNYVYIQYIFKKKDTIILKVFTVNVNAIILLIDVIKYKVIYWSC